MRKKELAKEVIERLKKEYAVSNMTRRGNFWSVSAWRHSVPMQG
jgi:hypothetical protein